jgi:1-acyl-sn-glycerol-3-phosphate acyltransferase
MKKRVLVFKPTKKAFLKKSPVYVVPMFLNTLALAAKYVMACVMHGPSLQETESYIRKFWQAQLQDSFTKLWVVGCENLHPEETYIYMSNHESWMDIPAIFGAVPSKLRMVSKKGIMQIPILGKAMANAGFVALDRRNLKSAIRQLEQAKERLKEGISIWIAPEGTRTRDGKMGPFKKGGFYLARELKKPIVPVFIEGAALVLPADSIMVNTNRSIVVHFLPPISCEEVASLSLPEVMDKVRAVLLNKQMEIQKESGHVSSC